MLLSGDVLLILTVPADEISPKVQRKKLPPQTNLRIKTKYENPYFVHRSLSKICVQATWEKTSLRCVTERRRRQGTKKHKRNFDKSMFL